MKFHREPRVIVRCALFWLCAIQLFVWVFDRKPPFELLAYTAMPVKRGETVEIRAAVWRDLSRSCSVTFSRYLYDSRGFRYDLSLETSSMTHSGIQQLQAVAPNELRISVPTPEAMAKGLAHFQTQLKYACGYNPLHIVWPIEVLMDIDLQII